MYIKEQKLSLEERIANIKPFLRRHPITATNFKFALVVALGQFPFLQKHLETTLGLMPAYIAVCDQNNNVGKTILPSVVYLRNPKTDEACAIPVGSLNELYHKPYLDIIWLYGRASWLKIYRELMSSCLDIHYITHQKKMSGQNWTPSFYNEHEEELIDINNSLVDNDSRDILAMFVKSRVRGNTQYIHPSIYTQYLHPDIPLEYGDIVFDLGVSGNISECVTFAEMVGPQGHVYSFEPDPKNFSTASDRLLQKNILNNIDLFPIAIANVQSDLFFVSDGASSRIVPTDEAGCCVVTATTIDAFMQEHKIPKLNFLKMDIEGLEFSALQGAMETLKQFRPKLAISVYHEKDDILRIYTLLSNLGLNYKFYLGHHTLWVADTVLYGICK